MMPVENYNFSKAIIYIKIIDNDTIIVVDSSTTVRYLEINSLKEKKSTFRAIIIHSRYIPKIIDFSSDGTIFASLSSDCRESKLYSITSKKVIAKVDRHHGEVSCVGIDSQDRYMFSCGDDGKTFGIDINSGQLALTLPVHVDSVSDIAFSNDGQLVATASYDKNIFIFSLSMMTSKCKLKAHSSAVVKILFLTQNRLFSVDKNSSAIIWDINTAKVIARLKGIHDDITKVTVGCDGKFLFLGTKLGYILVYDLDNYQLIDRRYIKLSHTITSLDFNNTKNQLIVGSDNGDLLFYYIFEKEDYLNDLLSQKNYSAMQDCINENLLLKYTNPSQILNALWQRTLQKAKEYLANRQADKAIKLFENFKTIPAKKQIMNRLIAEFKDFEKFIILVNQKKIPLAYSLANVHPVYKESKIYQTMELQWKKTFALAQKYILEPKSADKAVEILAPYRGVSEKTKLIQDLLVNAKVYRRFRVAIGQKDFKLSFELTKQHPFLKEYNEYETLIKYSDSLYIKSQILLDKGDTHSAIKLLRILLDFDDFKEEAKNIILDIENRQKFFNAMKDGNLLICYNLLNESLDLQDTEDGKKLDMLWKNDLNIANAYAANADVKGIKNILKKYMMISSKMISIATVLSYCYIAQLEKALNLKKEQRAIENGVKNYILYYGLSEDFLSFFNNFKIKYPDTKLNVESLKKGSLNSWRPSMIVDSILS